MTAATSPTPIEIPDKLWRVLGACQANCDSGCCGRDAFNFDTGSLREFAAPPDREVLPAARKQLDEFIVTLQAIPGAVEIDMIRDEWTGPEAAMWFTDFRRALGQWLSDVA